MRRVVVTGLGIVSCLGTDQQTVLDALRHGRSGIKFKQDYADQGMRSQVAGSIDLNLEELIDRKLLRFMGDAVPAFDSGALSAEGKRVVVIGGGDTAMDCVRTSIRQGAASVTCLYRRDKANMPGSMREVANAEEEGVRFAWLSGPDAFVGEDRVQGVQAVRMHLGMPDATGRQQVERLAGSEYVEPADLVIKALGFDPEDMPAMFGEPELAVTRWGTLKVDHRTMMTNLPGVFAAGDIVRGASLVVWGIRDGRDAADQIVAYAETRAVERVAAE